MCFLMTLSPPLLVQFCDSPGDPPPAISTPTPTEAPVDFLLILNTDMCPKDTTKRICPKDTVQK